MQRIATILVMIGTAIGMLSACSKAQNPLLAQASACVSKQTIIGYSYSHTRHFSTSRSGRLR